MSRPSQHEHEDDHTLAGEYVLGTLSLEQRKALEARLPNEPELQQAVMAWEERFLPYTAITDPVTPSDNLWPRIERSLASREALAKRARPASVVPPRPRRMLHSLSLWRGAAGFGLAAALVLGVLLANEVTEPTTPEYMVVLLAPQTQSAGWVVQASSRQEIELIPLGTFEVPEGKALEFWTKADEWQAPVSLGLVEPGQPIRLRLDELPPLEDNQLFELTLEDETGSATGLPTGPIEFIGRAVEI
ncbi:anti-sigma factor [Halomonas sp. FeN2]|uniref:Anti-sigma factor n=1 Tax=Vreelandella neptunia TaxID=115551 RepID=A0ABZ0YHL9_9GAMM|nr:MULTISPECIES: anti-sigma factor [Halomonas]TDV94494.1 anti-sigma-K factor RskA [Halomonas alkaliantarctica]MBF60008.1 RNA polymerase subunit sigma-70 [Halomonas sp.]MDN3560116.1 anti-sigma factor [Halomonas neptunia]UBR50410.1 anti-sigma factor [Halomonas sp. FeN2]WQH10892.1 anti-sigma factor [Halomonas neptunia]